MSFPPSPPVPSPEGAGEKRSHAPPDLVVGLGASAGGLQALKTFFGGLPDVPDIAFVVIVHLSPERESKMAEILQSSTSLTVVQVDGSVPLRGGQVYVIPPGRELVLTDGEVRTEEFENPRWRRAPIDTFFRSLAEWGERAVAIVLSGTGMDGSLGIRAVKEHGGLTLVQDPDEAEHDGMPRSVLRGGCADMALPAAELGSALLRFKEQRTLVRVPSADGGLEEGDAETLSQILGQLQGLTGHDFSRYKRSTLLRRVGRRMQVAGADSLANYLKVLRTNSGEATLLLKDLLISVTQFFRDPEVWRALEKSALAELFERQGGAERPLRAWVPSCATGEEAYTIAMLLLSYGETLDRPPPQVQVFASDLDESALAIGRGGVYPETIAVDVPERYLERFFTSEGKHYRVNRDVRESVLFATHSLFRNPPFSRLDLVSCRNLLIYLERDLQEDALRVFHYALRRNGVLVLGNAESAEAGSELFAPIEGRHRIYRRADVAPDHPTSLRPLQLLDPTPVRRANVDVAHELQIPSVERHQRLLETVAPPSIAVDRAYSMVHLSESAGRFLRRPGGIPSDDVLREIRPELRVELQEALEEAFQNRRPTSRGPVRVAFDGEAAWVHLIVRPGSAEPEERGLALVVFLEAGEADCSEADASTMEPLEDRRVAHLQDEVRRLRERLQITIEEYESSKEEMKASNEELQSINEEHKSTAEELETSREELQSVNEELESVNRELTGKVEELSQSNSDLQNLMAATEIGTLFLDRQLRIQRYTPHVSNFFHIRPSDHGRPITDLTHTLDYDAITDDARGVVKNLAPMEREVAGPDGIWLLVRFRPYRSVDEVVEGVVITFVDITRRKEAESGLRALTEELEQRVEERTVELRSALDLFHALFHAIPAPIAMTRSKDGLLVDANRAYRKLFGYGPEEMRDTRYLPRRHWTDERQREKVLAELAENDRVQNVEVELTTRSGERITALAFVERISVDDSPYELAVFIDISARKEAEQQVRTLASKLTIAEQEERSRVAHVLHDDLQQRLYGARYKLEGIRQRVKDDEATLAALEPLQEVEQWLKDAIEEMRRLTIDLSPPVLEGEGLADALAWLVSQMKAMHRLDVSLTTDKTHTIREPEQRIMMFQIVRELLFNVVKHAGVTRAEIRIAEQDGFWKIQVMDEGKGFDPKAMATSDPGPGFGLHDLRERVNLFGGALELDAAPGKGTRVTISLPIPPESDP